MPETVHLQQEQQTMLWTLAMHAHDAASSRPILDDRFAADLLARVDDPLDLGVSLGGNTPLICARAKLIDDAARLFLAQHDEAVVLHLGCGLDSRVLRLDPGPGVRWFDVDQEPVIGLRRRLYDEREGATTVAASVTDPSWWSQVPDDLPRLVLAEGLLMYLDPEGVRTAVGRALTPGATLVADTVAPWVTWIAGLQLAMRAADTGFMSSTNDLTAAAQEATPDDEVSLVDATATRTSGLMSTAVRLFALVPGGRDAMVLRTYRRA
ncbi:class I SAM-dependent methyltransferase [Actinomycetospora termitidis]|uniref:Class I SAM-dependent methyltransferase n=1 Tax=Actinomycetospora termitidis TaxID=3053470 RepID=A0ABT7MHL4_9PSEU|nr:class I SAM-dependent methyltransferase [Actinomycetospora sp. Odt1-22]MDL5160178.1 class I SAM-dependent methyltransferase [Actinomycetospora sp. Odt1-22]